MVTNAFIALGAGSLLYSTLDSVQELQAKQERKERAKGLGAFGTGFAVMSMLAKYS